MQLPTKLNPPTPSSWPLAYETETWLWRVVAAHTPMKVKLHANLNLVHVHAAQQQRVVGTV